MNLKTNSQGIREHLDNGDLSAILLASLEEGDMLICIKDNNKLVLKQNDGSKKLCGNREGQPCCTGCMEIFARDKNQQWENWGSRTYKNCLLHDNYFNVTLICSDQHLVTILQPLESKQLVAAEYYREMDLSKRETEVLSQVIAGLNNSAICQKFSISHSTLRTHLNNIYRKTNNTGASLHHIPKDRSNGAFG